MTNLRSREQLLGLLQQLYAGPGDGGGWTSFLDGLCDAIGGHCAHFISLNQRSYPEVGLTVRTDPDALREYRDHWHAFDPWGHSDRLRHVPPGTVVLAEEMIAQVELRRTQYYADFGRRYGLVRCMVAMVERTSEIRSVLSINRNERNRPFAAEERAFLNALMPHLQRALQLHRRIAAAEATASDFAGVLQHTSRAVFLVNAAGDVTWTNRAAEQLSEARDGVVIEDGELRAARSADTTRLRMLLADAAATSMQRGAGAGGSLALGRPSGRRPLMALVAPLFRGRAAFPSIGPAVAIVIVTDPERAPSINGEALRMLFALTAREVALTCLLAQGLAVSEVASRLGLRIDTVRTRLKTIFEKTGTHRQADLVRLVVGSTRV